MEYIDVFTELTTRSYLFAYESIMRDHQKYSAYFNEDISIYIFPAIMVSAFSCEVAIKKHIWNEIGEKRKGHDLQKLFKSMSQSKQVLYKDTTINAYNAKSQLQGHSARLDFEEFDEQLRKNRYAFTQSRYLYDNPKFVDLDFLEAFMFSLNDAIEDYEKFLKHVL